MNMLPNIKKIISVFFLCFVFLGVSGVPVESFGAVNSTSAYSGWEDVKKDVSAVQSVTHYGQTGTGQVTTTSIPVDLSVVNSGNHNLTRDQVDALTAARKAAGATDFHPEKIGLGEPKDINYYAVADNQGNVSYYYQASDDKNADRVFLGQVEDGNIYIPPNGFIEKTNKGTANNTNTATEQGFKNALDAEKGRPQNTTFGTLTAVDTYKQDQQTLPEDEAELARLQAQLAHDDEARNNDSTNVLSTEDRATLEKNIADTQATIAQKKSNIQTGARATAATQINTDSCPSNILEVGSFFTNSSCIVSLLAIVANTVLKMSSFLLYIVGNLFDYSIEIAVNSAQFFKTLGIVEPMWAVVRDFLNMTFIFVLIYIAWQILLGKGDYNAKNSVVRLVLVAILINFSLFAAKIMVDGSNVLSLNIYESIKQSDAANPDGVRSSVSARIMTTLGLASIYSFGDVFDGKTIPGCGGVPGTILTVGVFGTILISITILTFLLATIMFFLRMLNILALFITSPLWVWGYVIQHPFVKDKTDWWWKTMVGVLKFPVIYMLFLYVGLAMFAQLNSSQLSASGGQRVSFIQIICDTASKTGTNNVVNQLPVIINFLLVIAVLMGAIKYSVTDGAKGNVIGGKLADNISNKFDGFSKKITTGAAQGLYNKSANAVAATANFAGRNALALAKAPVALAGRGLRRGVRELGYKGAEWASETAAGLSMSSNSPKVATALAMLSNKLKDTKILGETAKEGEKRRTKLVTERADTLNKVQAEQTKIESEKAFLKKNPGGDYEKYIEEKINLIEDSYLGKLKDSVGPGKDSNGKEIANSTYLRQAIERDKDGKIKVNQDTLFRNLTTARAHHEDNGDLLKREKSRFGWITDERAKARIASTDKALRNRSVGKEKKIEDKIKDVEKDRETLAWLPTDLGSIDVANKSKYPSVIKSYITELEALQKRRTDRLAGAKTPDEINRITTEIDDDIQKLKNSTEEKITEAREKINNKIDKKLADIRKKEKEAEEKDKKK